MLHTATGLEAFIEVSDDNGATWTRLPEYKADIQARECKAFVEAKTGQRFRMRLLDANPRHQQKQLVARYYFDGQRAAGRVKDIAVMLDAISGLEVDQQTRLPFIFGNLQTTNNEREAQAPGLEDLGELRIEVWRVVIGKPTGKPFKQRKPDEAKYLEHRVKKRVSHQVTLGPEEPVMLGNPVACAYLDKDAFLQFRFRYMCEALLDLNGIKPFETNTASLSTFAAQGAQTSQAGPSSSTSRATSSRSKGNAARTRPNSSEIIDIDDDETSEVARLRAEVASLRKKVKTEVKTERRAQSKGPVIDLSEN